MTNKISSSAHVINSSPVIIALDYNNLNNALAFVDHIDPHSCRLKVGKEMFTLFGPHIVYELQKRGFEIFLDLKFHDIPSTCARAITAAAELGVWMVNVHASGGARMMTTAREALQVFGKDAPLLIAVTVLTSIETRDLNDSGVMLSPLEYAERLAHLAQKCGLDGVICSAQEIISLRCSLGQKFKLITPGIRPQGCAADDHRRIMTQEQALTHGANYIVIGRPLTQSTNPMQILSSINSMLNKK